MINFEIIEELKNLKENENILKILDIFWWNYLTLFNEYFIIIKTKYNKEIYNKIYKLK